MPVAFAVSSFSELDYGIPEFGVNEGNEKVPIMGQRGDELSHVNQKAKNGSER